VQSVVCEVHLQTDLSSCTLFRNITADFAVVVCKRYCSVLGALCGSVTDKGRWFNSRTLLTAMHSDFWKSSAIDTSPSMTTSKVTIVVFANNCVVVLLSRLCLQMRSSWDIMDEAKPIFLRISGVQNCNCLVTICCGP